MALNNLNTRIISLLDTMLKKPSGRSDLSWYAELSGYITTPLVAGYCMVRLVYPILRYRKYKAIQNKTTESISPEKLESAIVTLDAADSTPEQLQEHHKDTNQSPTSDQFITPIKEKTETSLEENSALSTSPSKAVDHRSYIFQLYDTLALKFQATQEGDEYADRKINMFLAGALVELLSELLRIRNEELLMICEEEARYFLNELHLGVKGDLIAKKMDIFATLVQDNGGKTYLDLGRAIALCSLLYKAPTKEYINRVHGALRSALEGLHKFSKYEKLREMSLEVSNTTEMKVFLNKAISILFLK